METGATWKGWKVVRVIGRGSFGTVYEIERDVLGTVEKAALKHITIPRDENETEELLGDGYDMTSISRRYDKYLKDIVREYTIMASLRGNTNIVICDDVEYSPREGGVGWEIFIRMELLTPILRVMDQYGRPEDAVWMGTDLCHALALCGEQHIIHRDIKPQNIFVDRRGQYKLGDFGVAKVASRTTAGTRVGTFRYMAPEVYHGQPYGAAADIYSLGLVLYWMLNRRRGPFVLLPPETPTARQEEDAQARRLRGEPLPPPADGSEELKRVVLRACAYAPEDRYRDAGAMLADLQALADTEPPVTGDETVEVEETVVQPASAPAAAETVYVDMGPEETVGPEVTEPAPEEKASPDQPAYPVWETPAPRTDGRGRGVTPPEKRRRMPWLLAVALVLGTAAATFLVLVLWHGRSSGTDGQDAGSAVVDVAPGIFTEVTAETADGTNVTGSLTITQGTQRPEEIPETSEVVLLDISWTDEEGMSEPLYITVSDPRFPDDSGVAVYHYGDAGRWDGLGAFKIVSNSVTFLATDLSPFAFQVLGP